VSWNQSEAASSWELEAEVWRGKGGSEETQSLLTDSAQLGLSQTVPSRQICINH